MAIFRGVYTLYIQEKKKRDRDYVRIQLRKFIIKRSKEDIPEWCRL